MERLYLALPRDEFMDEVSLGTTTDRRVTFDGALFACPDGNRAG